MWGIDLTPGGELLQYNCFPICGLPTWGVWDLIISQFPLLPSCWGSLDVEYLFSRLIFFIGGCLVDSCGLSILVGIGELRVFQLLVISSCLKAS